MRHLLVTALICFCELTSQAQLLSPHSEAADSGKLSYSCNIGTMYHYAPGLGSGNSMYVAPNFKWNMTPKLKIDAGIIFAHDQFKLKYQNATLGNQSVVLKNQAGSAGSYGGIMYANSEYTLTNKLSITGSLVSDFNSNPAYGQSTYNSLNYMSLGVSYKLSENVSLGGSLHLIQTNPLWLQNQFSNQGSFSDLLYMNNY